MQAAEQVHKSQSSVHHAVTKIEQLARGEISLKLMAARLA